jgi:hypothetical protein
VTHGGYAAVVRERLDVKVREVYEALAADAPLRDPDGELPRADAVVVSLFAECLCRLEDVRADVRDHGWKDRGTGDPDPSSSWSDVCVRRRSTSPSRSA